MLSSLCSFEVTGQTPADIERAQSNPAAALNAWASSTASRMDDVVDIAGGDEQAAADAFVQLGCESILGRAFRG